MASSTESRRDPLCRRCLTAASVIVIRNESMCSSCFQTFMILKVTKRMEAFRPKNSKPGTTRTLVLPISFGYSSLSLLRILTNHLERHLMRTGRKGFQIHVLYVDCSLDKGASEFREEKLKQLKSLYPMHSYSQISIDSIFDQDFARQISENGVEHTAPLERIKKLLENIVTPTSRSDVLSILLIRSIVQFAKNNSYEGILWGDNTTRLAERVMSEVSKGRGFSLPWQINNGDTPYGVLFHYPNRDVFKKELVSYLEMADPALVALVEESSESASVKNLPASSVTIDLLLKHYFETAEESHPGLLSNVVKTGDRLQPTVVGMQRCRLCTMPVTKAQLGIESWKGIQNINHDATQEDHGLCYGCSRSIPAEAVDLLP